MPRIFIALFLFACCMDAHSHSCSTRGKMDHVEVRDCGDAGIQLVSLDATGAVISQFEYKEVIQGIEAFWAQPCSCRLLQISGIGGAHTRISRVFRILDSGSIAPVAGGIFGSETGSINRISDGGNLYFDIPDIYRGKSSFERHRFDGARFTKVKSRNTRASNP